MDWKHFLAAVVVSGLVFSLTDWVFGGIFFHSKYSAHPEIQRLAPGKSETATVVWSVALGFLTAAAIVGACVVFAVRGYCARSSAMLPTRQLISPTRPQRAG